MKNVIGKRIASVLLMMFFSFQVMGGFDAGGGLNHIWDGFFGQTLLYGSADWGLTPDGKSLVVNLSNHTISNFDIDADEIVDWSELLNNLPAQLLGVISSKEDVNKFSTLVINYKSFKIKDNCLVLELEDLNCYLYDFETGMKRSCNIKKLLINVIENNDNALRLYLELAM